MFSRAIKSSFNFLNLINKQRQSIKRFSNSAKLINELHQFDYDKVASDFDAEIYKEILEQEDAFNVSKLIDLSELFEKRCHLGHKTGSLNDYMRPYIFGHRQDVAIFDLNQTIDNLKNALNFAAHIAFRDGVILFVNPAKEVSSCTIGKNYLILI